jgi:hypothetical protein
MRSSAWHCGTREAFLWHVSSALDTIKKRGTFKAYKGAHEAYVEQRKAAKEAKANMSLFTTTTSEGKKAKKGTEKLPRRLLGRTALIKRRLLRRPRKARLRPMHQPQNFAKSTRPSMRRPFSQKRPPRTRKMPLRPKCFSFTQTCCLRMQSTHGTR